MTAQPTAKMHSGSGTPISLGSEIARGGEGRILDVRDRPDLVAKVYHRPIGQEKATKLSLMVSLKTDRLLNLTAWPVDTLHDLDGGPVSGFLMPRLTGHKDIHILYGVKSRNAEYPEARWPFLIQSAANIARAFNVIHEHGHIIGDVNHGSIVVSKRATVRLVDCDSFQITAQGNRFLCEVGISTHLPPELQGKDLHGIVRTVDHDSFGLAVIIFQLLFMGRHPFSGTSLSPGDISLETAIKEHRFAYGPGASSRQMRQPPATLGLDAVSPQIAELFERSFLNDVNRPAPKDWIEPLAQLGEDLQKCTQDSAHYFLNALIACPWCEIESHSGIILFQNALVDTAHEFFDMVKAWVNILSVKPPPPDAIPDKSAIAAARPTPESLKITRRRHLHSGLAIILLVTVSIILIVLNPGFSARMGFLTFLMIKVMSMISNITNNSRKEMSRLREVAIVKVEQARKWWKDNSSAEAFSRAVEELEEKKEQYQNLADLKYQKIDELQKVLWERELHDFLSAQKIRDADLPGITTSNVISLRSYGIETADDISARALKNIQGLKDDQVDMLVHWRTLKRRTFNHQPKPAANPSAIASVESEILNTKLKLQRDLRNGPAYLQQLRSRGQSIAEAGRPEVTACLATLVQAEEDVRYCNAKLWFGVAGTIYFLSAILFLSSMGFRSENPKPVVPGGGVTFPKAPQLLNNRSLPENKKATELYDRGVNLANAGDNFRAGIAFRQAILLSPTLTGAQRELGWALYQQRRYKGASDAFKIATVNDPQDAPAFSGLGLSLKAAGQFGDSVVAFQRATQLEPNDGSNYYNLGLSYKGLKDYVQALAAFKQACKLQPTDAYSHYQAGLAYLQLNRQSEAISEFVLVNSLDPALAKRLHLRLRQTGIESPEEPVKPPSAPK